MKHLVIVLTVAAFVGLFLGYSTEAVFTGAFVTGLLHNAIE